MHVTVVDVRACRRGTACTAQLHTSGCRPVIPQLGCVINELLAMSLSLSLTSPTRCTKAHFGIQSSPEDGWLASMWTLIITSVLNVAGRVNTTCQNICQSAAPPWH